MNDIEYEKKIWGLSGIYMWTSPSGKKYIGQSNNLGSRHKDFRCASLSRKYAGVSTVIDKARQKYPYDQWKYDIIEFCSVEDLGEREKHWIEYYNTTNNKYGYNIAIGGVGGNGVPKTAFKKCHVMTEEQKRKSKETLKKHIEEGSVNYDNRGLKIALYDKEGNFIMEFPTVKKASKWCNVHIKVPKVPDSHSLIVEKYMIRRGDLIYPFPQKIEPYSKKKRKLSIIAKAKISLKKTGRPIPSRYVPVVALNNDGTVKYKFKSVKEAAHFVHPENPKSAQKNITQVINKRGGYDSNGLYHIKKKAYGLKWEKAS